MNKVYGYNSENKRYEMQFNGDVYFFTYNHEKFAPLNFWNKDGKLMARSYKGFRNSLGIHQGSAQADELMQTIKQCRKIK